MAKPITPLIIEPTPAELEILTLDAAAKASGERLTKFTTEAFSGTAIAANSLNNHLLEATENIIPNYAEIKKILKTLDTPLQETTSALGQLEATRPAPAAALRNAPILGLGSSGHSDEDR